MLKNGRPYVSNYSQRNAQHGCLLFLHTNKSRTWINPVIKDTSNTLAFPEWQKASKIVSSHCFESPQENQNVAEGKIFSSPESRMAKWILFCCSKMSYFILSCTAKSKANPGTLCWSPIEILDIVTTPQARITCLIFLNPQNLEISH